MNARSHRITIANCTALIGSGLSSVPRAELAPGGVTAELALNLATAVTVSDGHPLPQRPVTVATIHCSRRGITIRMAARTCQRSGNLRSGSVGVGSVQSSEKFLESKRDKAQTYFRFLGG